MRLPAMAGAALDDNLPRLYPGDGFVEDQIDLARAASSPPAIPVAGCAPPVSAATNACTDLGAVSRGTPALFFYQVRAFCDPASEGP